MHLSLLHDLTLGAREYVHECGDVPPEIGVGGECGRVLAKVGHQLAEAGPGLQQRSLCLRQITPYLLQ